MHWCIPVVREFSNLNEAFQVMLMKGSPDYTENYRNTTRAAAKAVAEVNAWAWEMLAMEKCLKMAAKMSWQTLWHLRRGRRNQAQTLLNKCGTVLNSIGDIVE